MSIFFGFFPDGDRLALSAEGLQLLLSYSVDTNALVTVNSQNCSKAEIIYSFLKHNGIRFQQYIPCIDPINGKNYPFSLPPEAFGYFLIDLFKLYYNDWKSGDYVSIRYFDNLVRILTGQLPEECGMFGKCTFQYVIEADGSVYPC